MATIHPLDQSQVNGIGKDMRQNGTSVVARLVPRETFGPDVRALSQLALLDADFDQSDLICEGLEELSKHLRRLEDDYRSANLERLEARARRLVLLADRLGLRQVGQVAADVVYCIDRQEETALSATVSRLMRLMTQALDHAAGPITAF